MGHIAEALKKARRTSSVSAIKIGDRMSESAVSFDSLFSDRQPAPSGPSPYRMLELRGLADSEKAISDAETEAVANWDVHPCLIAQTRPNGSVAEQYRGVRTWLMSRMNSGRRNALALTASTPGEGITVTTANLARVLAEIRQLRIVAVDSNVRTGKLAEMFGLPDRPGLSDVLCGDVALKDALLPTPLGNLFVLPAGGLRGPKAAELLSGSAAAGLFEQFRGSFNFCLVDTPPVQSVSDVGAIARHCSGVLMVVRMRATPSHVVQQSLQWLQENHLPVLGCIATACSLKDALYDPDVSDPS